MCGHRANAVGHFARRLGTEAIGKACRPGYFFGAASTTTRTNYVDTLI